MHNSPDRHSRAGGNPAREAQVRKNWIPAFAGMTLLMVSGGLLSGCLVQSKIQGRYIDDQGECQDYAENNIDQYTRGKNLTAKDKNAELVTLFSDCMGKQGWQVAKPKKSKTVVTTTGPHGPLDPYGRSATTTTVTTTTEKPAATQQPNAAQTPVETQTTPLSPSPSQPPLNPPATDQTPAMYQPGRPDTQMPTYGTGAGRSF